MQKIDNLYVSELEFDESGMRGPKGDSGDSPSLYVEKIADFLYKAEARDMDYPRAEMFVRKNYPVPANNGACASIRNGVLFGHNFDGRYDTTAEFVVHTRAKRGNHASIGIAAIPGILTSDMADAATEDDLTKEAYCVLPFFMIDGVNDAGVAVSMHFMQDADTVGAEDDSGMCALFAVRYLLDNANSADDALRLIRMKEFWFPKNERIKSGFYLQICDLEHSYFADLYGNRKLCENETLPILTNFRTITWDGTENTLEEHANGIERYRILSDAYSNVENESDIISLLKSIRYTGVYDTTKEDFWYSDYNGDWTELGYGNLTIHSDLEDYNAAVTYAVDQFSRRIRNGTTMQTMHTAIYDIELLTMAVLVQEKDEVYRFTMDNAALIYDEIERAKAAEEAIRNDFIDDFYLKTEVDDAIRDVNDNMTTLIAGVDESVQSLNDSLTAMIESGDESLSQAIEDMSQSITDQTDEKLLTKMDAPTNMGEIGQVIYKVVGGSEWGNLPEQLPDVGLVDDDKVLTVENGRWVASDKFVDYIRYCNITVTITSDNGHVSTGGLTVVLKDGDTGDTLDALEYEGQPVTFRAPRGMHYIIEQTGTWEGYHDPTPEYVDGVATTDTSVIFTYHAISIPNTLRELQIIVNDGNASTLAGHVGLQFPDIYTENGVEYNILWDLKDVHEITDPLGQRRTAVFLQWHSCTPTALPFDAPERVPVDLSQSPNAEEGLYYYGMSGTNYTMLNIPAGSPLPTTYDAIYVNEIRSQDASIIRRGYSRYSDSVPRKWLNSDGNVGEWFEPSHIGDAAPSQADSIPGFKKGCSEQILSMVKPVIIDTASSSSSTYQLFDEFFIPSVTEVYGIQDSAAEGTPWMDWVYATGFNSPSNSATNGRKVYTTGNLTAQKVGLRSANVGYQYVVWDISTDGSLDGYANASALKRFTPCCVIY